jgi:outer membrane lipoprotein SlyB
MTSGNPISFTFKRGIGSLALIGLLSLPTSGFAQRTETQAQRHERAKRAQTAHDHRHHTGAKIVGGSAAGGAVAGALLGGGKGALIGGAVGAGGGAIANKVRTDKGVKKRERQDRREDRR